MILGLQRVTARGWFPCKRGISPVFANRTYNAILRRRDILAVHPGYFELTGGIERWLYRLARKAVPDRADFPGISFRMETLFTRSGLSGRLRWFRAKLEDIEARQPLPEYDIAVNRDGRHELVTLLRNRAKPGRRPRGRRPQAGG